MSNRIRVVLIVISILCFVVLLLTMKRNRTSPEVATAWVLFSLSLIVIAIFPKIAFWMADILGVETTMNAILLFVIFIMLVLLFYLYMKFTKLDNKFNEFVQKYSIEHKDNNRKE